MKITRKMLILQYLPSTRAIKKMKVTLIMSQIEVKQGTVKCIRVAATFGYQSIVAMHLSFADNGFITKLTISISHVHYQINNITLEMFSVLNDYLLHPRQLYYFLPSVSFSCCKWDIPDFAMHCFRFWRNNDERNNFIIDNLSLIALMIREF